MRVSTAKFPVRGLSASKAWIGATLAATSAASVALVDGNGISWAEVPVIISAFVAGYQGVYWTNNARNKVGDRKAQIDK